MTTSAEYLELRQLSVDVLEPGDVPRRGAVGCFLGTNIKFSTAVLETFAFSNWESVVYDAMVVAAAIEYCDRRLARSARNWGRRFDVLVSVHSRDRWSNEVVAALTRCANFLTGDDWNFTFRDRRAADQTRHNMTLEFPVDAAAVIAFSDGMDSQAVAGLEALNLGRRLVRIRVGKSSPPSKVERQRIPFVALPYRVQLGEDNAESTARSRGFKFGLAAAIAAYLVNAPNVIVPESGQGALAPALLQVGQGYPDYRSHPTFTVLLERFVKALLGHDVRYVFPRLWYTKAETLREFVDTCGAGAGRWAATRSCWQGQRQTSISGKWRQCGICAACMLRRMAVHAARLQEASDTYVWENLSAESFSAGASIEANPRLITEAMREYALAGVLHLEHFAALRNSPQYDLVRRRSLGELSRSLVEPLEAVGRKFDRMLQQHQQEWAAFTASFGERSFVRGWIEIGQ